MKELDKYGHCPLFIVRDLISKVTAHSSKPNGFKTC